MSAPDPPQVTIRLAIAPGSDPIEGSVAIGDEEPRGFQTWFELIAAVDSARDQGASHRRDWPKSRS